MSSKDEILKAIRALSVPAAALPSLDQNWIAYDDRYAQFKSLLESVGGQCVRVERVDQIPALLAENPAFASASRVISTVPGIESTVALETITDPHDLENIDWGILSAQFGVAENGAVWVTDEQLPHRALYFIVQHLALVMPADQFVNNMHEAYARLAIGSSTFGAFISGPSKTADIEQSLVVGAHGPRSMTLFCVG